MGSPVATRAALVAQLPVSAIAALVHARSVAAAVAARRGCCRGRNCGLLQYASAVGLAAVDGMDERAVRDAAQRALACLFGRSPSAGLAGDASGRVYRAGPRGGRANLRAGEARAGEPRNSTG